MESSQNSLSTAMMEAGFRYEGIELVASSYLVSNFENPRADDRVCISV